MAIEPARPLYPELYLPHVGWLFHELGDEVAVFLNQGWFEYKEQAFTWLYLRDGDTFVDCGAHFGLYAVLAGQAVAAGTILAMEANPATVPYLSKNLERHGLLRARLVQKALYSKSGETRFYPSQPGQAAYSSLIPNSEHTTAVPVTMTTLDELVAEHRLSHVDFVKIDVEGAEIEALRGAARSIAEDRLPLIMIECTERNLLRAGSSTRELFELAESMGCQVLRFHANSRRLIPCSYEGPVWYENLFLTRHPEVVNDRLQSPSHEHSRVAREILQRGAAAADLYQRAEEARQKITEAQAGAEETYRRLGEANWWIEETRRQLLEARQEATEASLRAQKEEGLKTDAYRVLSELVKNLRPYLTSRYVQLGWKLKLIHKPEWLMRFAERERLGE